MGKGEGKAPQAKRSHDAEKANNVNRRPKANRCRATRSLGKGQSGKEYKENLVCFPHTTISRTCLRAFADTAISNII